MIRRFYDTLYKSKRKIGAIESLKQHRRLLLLRSLLSQCAILTIFVGCGSGRELALVENGDVIGIDISHRALAEARDIERRVLLVVGDALQLPFRDGIANQVVISETLEHLSQPTQALDEICRICAEEANLIVTFPNALSIWGFAKQALELLLRRRVTASNQPIDTWFTLSSLKALLAARFEFISVQGAWYFPPLGKDMATIESEPLAEVMKRLVGIDVLLGRILPSLGHVVGVKAVQHRIQEPHSQLEKVYLDPKCKANAKNSNQATLRPKLATANDPPKVTRQTKEIAAGKCK